MMELKNMKLGEIITFKNGKKRPIDEGNIPVYGGNGILGYTNANNYKNCIAIGRVGAYCGSVYYEPNECWISDNAIAAIPNKGIDTYYTFYLLRSLHLNHRHIGTSQPLLTQEILNKIECKIPEFEKQVKIAKILQVLDNKIKNNEAINRNLSEQVQAIYKSWFIDFEPFGGKRPINWKILKFEDFIKLRNEKSDDESIPMYAVTDTGIYPRDEKFKKKLSKFGSIFKVVRKTDLVFGMSREILNWGILHEDIAGVSSAYTVYEVDAKINSLYLEYYINLQSEYFRDIIRLASREGQGIDRGILQKKELYIPEEQWINRFLDIAYGLLCKADKANAENEQLMAIRDTLLPKLMSGELDISNIDI